MNPYILGDVRNGNISVRCYNNIFNSRCHSSGCLWGYRVHVYPQCKTIKEQLINEYLVVPSCWPAGVVRCCNTDLLFYGTGFWRLGGIWFVQPLCSGLIAFSSYNPPKNNVKRDVLLLSFANLFTSLYTAFVIFCILGYKGYKSYEKCLHE